MTHPPRPSRLLRFAAILTLAACGLTLSAGETRVLAERFANASPEETAAVIRSETAWYGFAKGGGKLPRPKEATFDTVTGDVLEFSAQSQGTLIAAAFRPVELKQAGDYIQLSVEYRYVYPLKGVAPAFVVGLYDSRGAPLTAGDLRKDLDAAGAPGSDHAGYRLAKLPGDVNDDLQLDQATGLGALFPQAKIATAGSGLALGHREMHLLTLRITVGEDGGLAFAYGVDGIFRQQAVARSKTAVIRFDEVSICPLGRGFERGSGNIYIQLGNVTVARGGVDRRP